MMARFLATVLLAGMALASNLQAGRVIIVGDSTVASYDAADPKRGWGQMIGDFLADGTSVTNLAIPGASSKTFLASPNWAEAVKPSQGYLLIQFGHNDGKIGKHPGATAADGEFRDNLRRMIREGRSAGLMPILVTPMHRVKFDTDGVLTAELAPYAEAIKTVAAEETVPVVDLYSASGAEFQKRGDAGSLELNPSVSDRVHFSAKGATLLAAIVAGDLIRIDPALARHP